MTDGMDAAERARLLELVAGRPNPYGKMLGVTVDDVQGPGHVALGLSLRPDLGNRNGVMHGGAIMSLIDEAGSGAVRSLQQPGEPLPSLPTTDLNVTFVNAARGSVTATGRVVRRGRSIAFTQVEVHDEAGTLVALGRATYVVVLPS